MSNLSNLRKATTLYQVANLLGFQTKSVSYILYKLPPQLKYTAFSVPKKSGGVRAIAAPDVRLKLLQTRLAEVLYRCQTEIMEMANRPNSVSHGFEKGRSIFSNAWEHKNRRFVLNIDLEGFFPSINFGRVRGFFMKDRNFALEEKTATILAQIACFNNELPQGSPCSPVISNFVAHILDVRLTNLAKNTKCQYTRYVDDISFSTNAKDFPITLAQQTPESEGLWELGQPLIDIITRSGFRVNVSKTRMQCRPSLQTVTGLTVNNKVNIKASYYREARSKCNALFRTGKYHMGKSSTLMAMPPLEDDTTRLEGALAHIYNIKHRSDVKSGRLAVAKTAKDSKVAYPAYREIYKHFLYFKRFVNLDKPFIVCEGKTDNIYLRCALKSLAAMYPRLGKIEGTSLITSIRFLKHGSTEHEILELSGGSAKLASFVGRYNKAMQRFKFRPLKHPVIVLIDNDAGASDVFSATKEHCKPKPSLLTKANFYFVCYNLYIIKTPEIEPNGTSCIEDLFDAKLLGTLQGGKSFDKSNDLDTASHYGKFAFADRVVRPNVATANFAGFQPLFDRIIAVMDDYETRYKTYMK